MPSAPSPINEEHIPDQFFVEFPPMIILGNFNYHIIQYAATTPNSNSNTATISQPRVTFNFPSFNQGPGIWRAHPRLAVNAYFQKALTKALDQFHSHLEICPSNDSPQQQWDAIKSLVRDIAQKIERRKQGAHKRMLTRSQIKRNKLLRQFKLSQILPLRLYTIEKQIGIIQQEVTETHALRAGSQWQENGEKSACYLKRIIEQRSVLSCLVIHSQIPHVRRNILSLRHPTTNQLCTSNSELQSATVDSYNNLYTPSPINSIAISTLAPTISSEHQIPPEKQHTLIKPFTFTDIESQANRSPKKSSPGKDGIPYEILHLLLQHPPTARLALSIFNDALTNRIFPDR
ncbi:hypothetical protein G6F56_009961 [Rhizopus delemar]|nr:hypothetical protein G6F56_009961 [Rhizopus delemar]